MGRGFGWSRGAMLATTALGFGAGSAFAQENPPTERPVEAAEVIVVTGVRESLAAARDLKRDDARVVDTIVAEDIAQFPQKNLSEAIQRISGTQIRRDFAGGVGNEISIRGLAPEYTAVTLNGQAAPSGADSRSFNFNVLPAELFRSVEVAKSPDASMDEGGIGGTVTLETIRPADLRGRNGVLSAEASHNSITEQTDPRVTAVLGGEWGRFGLVAGLAYSKFGAASESYDSVRWRRRNFSLAGQTFNQVWLMDLPRYIVEQQDTERLALTLSGSYEISPQFEILADGFYTRNEQDYTRNSPIYFFDSATGLTSIDVRDEIVEQASFSNVRFQAEDLYGQRDTDTYAVRLRGNYESGGWSLRPFLTASQAEYTQDDYRYFGDVRGPAGYDIRQDDDYFTITSTINIADPALLTVREARNFLAETTDTEAAVGVDADFDVSDAIELAFGAKYRDRSKERNRFEARRTGINEPFAPVSTLYTGFLDDEDRATGPDAFVVFDQAAAYAAYGAFLDPRTAPQINNYFLVEEQVTSGYAMATWDSGPWLLNAGLRIAHTELTSSGTERNRTLNIDTAREVGSSYTDVLPSANLRYEVLPKVYLRASAARVMTRPNLADLAAYREINEATRVITARNPDLEPFRATQFDLAAEWYFGEDGLLSIGYFNKDIESFIATRSSTIDFNGDVYTLTQPVNANEASLSGFELNYQQSFSSLPGIWKHFGVAANYTYTDSNFQDTVSGADISYGLPENSEDSYNLTGYYEDDRLTVRVAHNFRGAFLREIPNAVDGIKIRDDYQQTDVSVRFNVVPNVQLTMDVLNALDSQPEEYVFQPRLTDGIFTNGRTWQFGLRADF